jgi:hypothetical protein
MTNNDNNPFRNALPRLLTKDEFRTAINSRPELFPETLENNLLEIGKVESDFMYGLSRHYYFYERVLSHMYESYRIRTPQWLIKKIVELKTVAREEIIIASKDQIRQVQSVRVTYLSGIAGTGKTSIINFLLRQMPKMIRHPEIGITQVPILKIQTPPRGTRKDLCREILRELDDILDDSADGTVSGNYSLGLKRIGENEFTDYVKQILVAHFIGCIIFDEFQDLRVSKNGPTEQTLAFVKRLTNSLGIPIIFVGSPEMEDIIFGNFQLATRAQGYVWDRLDKKSLEWDRFIKALFKQNIFGEKELSNDLMDFYYELTQGIPRLLVKLHVEAQRVALYEKAGAIATRHLIIAMNTLFKSVSIPILGIKRKIQSILDRYPDLANIEDFSDPEETSEKLAKKEEGSEKKENSKLEKTEEQLPKHKLDISQYRESSLLSYLKNCQTEMDVYNVFSENKIILPVSELIEF